MGAVGCWLSAWCLLIAAIEARTAVARNSMTDALRVRRAQQGGMKALTSTKQRSRRLSQLGDKQPLSMSFVYDLDSTRSAGEVKYMQEKLMPAVEHFFKRSVRVREPLGPIDLTGAVGFDQQPLGVDTLDTDMLIAVTSSPSTAEECQSAIAGAVALYFVQPTNRPIVGVVNWCRFSPSNFLRDLRSGVHEILHALVMDPDLMQMFLGYSRVDSVLHRAQNGWWEVATPNVQTEVQLFFNCSSATGASLEDDGAQGTAGSHWDQRLFEGEMMDGVDAGIDLQYTRHVLTDLTLALLHDSGWYDVKYGSAGFNSFGYHAGCSLAEGTFEEAIQTPSASRYLCRPTAQPKFACTHDYAADGVCWSDPTWDGFSRIEAVPQSYDCASDPGQRCLERSSNDFALGSHASCVDMSCSPSGEVLINGQPCQEDEFKCPDAVAMCQDPGYLTCSTYNDCSGNGDCFRGNCFCHTGFGGDSCDQVMCSQTCSDGRACPLSGFCGVDECGEWTNGPEDRGKPCNALETLTFAPAPAPTPLPTDVAETGADPAQMSSSPPQASNPTSSGTGTQSTPVQSSTLATISSSCSALIAAFSCLSIAEFL